MTLKQEYEKLTGEREGYLELARKHSTITIPSLIPPDGTGKSASNLYEPYQSIGGFGVNALANKLAGALIPPAEAFFKFQPLATAEEFEGLDQATMDAISAKLSETEQTIMSHLTQRGDRSVVIEAVKHLLVGGNVVLYIGDEKSRFYALDEYVAIRDGEGNLLKLITLDVLDYETYKENNPEHTEVHVRHKGNRSWTPSSIEVYTSMCRQDGQWVVVEECKGVQVSKNTYKIDEPPYLALRFNRIDGQSYGRAYVESLYGDLKSLEILSKAMTEGAAISARSVFLVNPSGATSPRLFANADNGDTIPGLPGDIAAVRVDKGGDLAVADSHINRLETRLNIAFMLSQGFQRDAERVTATEVKAMAAELEAILGGAYSILSEEFQRPYINRLIGVLKKERKVPEFPEGVVEVAIVTGTAGIGRSLDREKMLEFFSVLQQSLGPEVMQQYVSVDVALSRLIATYGINPNGLIKSAQQRAQEQQEAQQLQLASQLGPQAIQAAGAVEQETIRQQGNQNDSQETPG